MMSDAATLVFITAWFVLFSGSPDLVDRFGEMLAEDECVQEIKSKRVIQ